MGSWDLHGIVFCFVFLFGLFFCLARNYSKNLGHVWQLWLSYSTGKCYVWQTFLKVHELRLFFFCFFYVSFWYRGVSEVFKCSKKVKHYATSAWWMYGPVQSATLTFGRCRRSKRTTQTWFGPNIHCYPGNQRWNGQAFFVLFFFSFVFLFFSSLLQQMFWHTCSKYLNVFSN